MPVGASYSGPNDPMTTEGLTVNLMGKDLGWFLSVVLNLSQYKYESR